MKKMPQPKGFDIQIHITAPEGISKAHLREAVEYALAHMRKRDNHFIADRGLPHGVERVELIDWSGTRKDADFEWLRRLLHRGGVELSQVRSVKRGGK